MLKLFKYDWKRNSTVFYATLVILIIVQLALFTWNSLRSGWDGLVTGLSVLAIVAAMFVLFYQVCKTFNHHMSAYNRRLLPVKPIQEIAAVLLLQVIYAVSTLIIAAGCLVLIISSHDSTDFDALFDLLKPVPVISSLTYSIWGLLNLTGWIMLSIAIAWSFRVKHRIWIGIAAFIGLQSIISWLALLILGFNAESTFGFIRVSSEGQVLTDMKIDWFDPISGPFLMEVIIFICLLYATAYLMKNKVEC